MSEQDGPLNPDSEPGVYGDYKFESDSGVRPQEGEYILPPWTDPPTGEIPMILSELDQNESALRSRFAGLRISSALPPLGDSAEDSAKRESRVGGRVQRTRKSREGFLAKPRIDESAVRKFNVIRPSDSDGSGGSFNGRSEVGGGVVPPPMEGDSEVSMTREMELPSRRINISTSGRIGWLRRSGNRGQKGSVMASSELEQSPLDHDSTDPEGASDSDDNLYAPSSFVNRKEHLASSRSRRAAQGRQRNGTSLSRIFTGAALGLVVLLALHFGPETSLAVVAVAVVLSAIEFYDTVRRAGFRPASLLGIAAALSLVLTTYIKGANGAPLVIASLVIASMLWYLLGVIRGDPTTNISITFLGVVWIGGLGSFGAALLRPQEFPHSNGVALLLGAVIVTVANDTVAYFFGSWFGNHKMAPDISPTKSWEGLIAGTVASVLIGALAISQIPPWTVSSGTMLGIVAAVVAPLGDLSESMIKRDLHIKDMGKILPGHGGMLDRIDGLLFVLPAVYYMLKILHLS